MGWQIVVHAEGTSAARSSSARAVGMTAAIATRIILECMLRIRLEFYVDWIPIDLGLHGIIEKVIEVDGSVDYLEVELGNHVLLILVSIRRRPTILWQLQNI